jgi:hypothetical protein
VAGQSATSASNSATSASTSASNALTYRNQASQSETNASGYATAAAQDYTVINARLNSAGGSGVSVEQSLTANANSITGLYGQYTVKIDGNGYVSGFGLASTSVSGATLSDFIVRSDRFAIANPSGPGVAPSMPFIVQTTATTLNGVNVPVGVYMRDAFILNGSITNAKIGTAAIDTVKIADAAIVSAKIGDLQVGTAKIAVGAIDNARIAFAAISSANIQDAAITNAKIGLLSVDRLRIAGNAVTLPVNYTSADSTIDVDIFGSASAFAYVGTGLGDYTFSYFSYYQYVGPGNGDWVYSNEGVYSGGKMVIETPMIEVGDTVGGSLMCVFYGTVDATVNHDSAQILVMYADSGAGYQVVGATKAGAVTTGGNTRASLPITMCKTLTNVQSVRIKVVAGRSVIATGGTYYTSTLRNITISALGIAR